MHDSFSYFVNQLISGVSLGAIYGLIAIGYTMVYGIIGMINFAHGEIFMIGAFTSLIAFFILGALGISWIPLAILAMLVLAVIVNGFYGWTLERVAYRPLRGSTRLAPLITAIGMSIFLQNYVQLLQGARRRPLQSLIPGSLELWSVRTPDDTDYAVQISFLQIFIIVSTIVLMLAFTYLITRTPLGRAQRACEQDRKMAALIGIDVDKTIAMTFVIGATLAAVAGLIYTLRYGSIDFFIGFLAGVKAFTAAVLGGIGSLPGAMIGGILIGVIESLYAGYIDTQWNDVAVFSILVIVLIFRPSGLLGRPDIEKV